MSQKIKEKKTEGKKDRESREETPLKYMYTSLSMYDCTLWSDRVRRFEKKFAECDNIFCKISVLVR